MLLPIVLLWVLPEIVVSQIREYPNELNLGFEKFNLNHKVPSPWYGQGDYYSLRIDSLYHHNGRVSILIEPAGEISSYSNGTVGSGKVGSIIPANFEGKEIELRAFMKFKEVTNGSVGLFLTIYGKIETLEFDNMRDKKIQGTSDWACYSIKLPYPPNAKNVSFGAWHSGTGQLWVDDFEILIDDKDLTEAKFKDKKEYKITDDKEFDGGSNVSSINVNSSKIDDLTILGQLWGYLKYYHPKIAQGEINWDYELFRILPKIVECKTKDERNTILSEWVGRLGAVKNGLTPKFDSTQVKLVPDLSWIDAAILGNELIQQLMTIKDAEREFDNYYELKLYPEKNEKPYSAIKCCDAGFRLLSLYRYWNIIQYYFPYKSLIGENWNGILREFIPKILAATSEFEYKQTVLMLITKTHDTHASMTPRISNANNYPPFEIEFIEDKAVVSNFYEERFAENLKIRKGDVVESINGKSVDQIVNERILITPASNHQAQLREIARDLLRTTDRELTISYKRKKSLVSTQVKCYSVYEMNIYKKYEYPDTCFKILRPDIAYLYAGSLKTEYLPRLFKLIANKKGLIIDLRCYPSDIITYKLAEYLVPYPTSFVRISVPSVTTPGLFTLQKPYTAGEENPNYFKGKVVILVNENTQSQAEFAAMAFRTAPKSQIIGSTTAGTDGNVVLFTLPSGIETAMSGIGIYYPDGQETQRKGISIDIKVKRTIRGYSKGKDEILDKAIQIIK